MRKPNPNSGPTMHDVAALAGVSQATVSLVLNDVSGSRFSQKTKDKVEKAVEQLGYRTNAHAKVLREGVSGMVGFVGDVVASAPFAGKIIEGAQERAWESGLLVLTVNTNGDRELERASLEAMLSYKVAGVVYASMYHRKVDVPAALRGVPSVVLNSEDRDRQIPSIIPDEELGGYAATKRLLNAGHRRVAMINIETLQSGLPAALGRYAGYTRAINEAGLTVDPAIVRFGDGNPGDGHRYTREVMAAGNPPTAIFCANDRTAWGAYQALDQMGCRIPEDVAVIGFDNQETLAPYLQPGLTTMDLPFVSMGRRAVEMLIEGGEPDGRIEALECALIERSSVTNSGEAQ